MNIFEVPTKDLSLLNSLRLLNPFQIHSSDSASDACGSRKNKMEVQILARRDSRRLFKVITCEFTF